MHVTSGGGYWTTVSYSEENIEGVQVQTLNTFGIKKQIIYVKVASFKEFTNVIILYFE